MSDALATISTGYPYVVDAAFTFFRPLLLIA
jgi:hypothetical protein